MNCFMKTTNLRNSFLIGFLTILFTIQVKAQEHFGPATSNYSPTSGMFLNPSSIVDSKAFVDIHLVGAGAFLDNNLVYLSKDEFKLTRGMSQFNDELLPRQNLSGGNKFGYSSVLLQGPSVTAVLGRFSIGFHTAARAVVDARNISPTMSNFIFEGLSFEPQLNTQYRESDLKANALAWAEAGLTFGGILIQQNKHQLSGAFTARRLIGIGAASAQIDDLDFLVGDSAALHLNNLTGSLATTMPGWNNGRGWGFNIGFTYKKMKEEVNGYKPHSRQSNCEAKDYQYKVGISLLDAGSIRFDRQANSTTINNASLHFDNYNDINPSGPEQLDSLLNASFQGDVSSADNFKMALPTALSLQLDYNVGKNFYLAAVWIHGFSPKSAGVTRASVVNLTPRFEHKRVEVSLPVSLYDYRHPRVGLAFRFNSVVIGTDRLGPLLFNPDVYGMDLYVQVKYTLFKSRACKVRKQKQAKVDDSKIAPCPSW
jgi:hypothetical protein